MVFQVSPAPGRRSLYRNLESRQLPEREQRERTLSTLNKIGALIADPAIRACIAQPRSKLDLKDIIESGKVRSSRCPRANSASRRRA